MGLKGHLTCGEILEQLVHARQVAAIRNVVFMVGWVVSLWKQSKKKFVIAAYNRELVIIWIRIVYLDQILKIGRQLIEKFKNCKRNL